MNQIKINFKKELEQHLKFNKYNYGLIPSKLFKDQYEWNTILEIYLSYTKNYFLE